MALPVADQTFGIKKSIIFPGKGDFSDFKDGTKVIFHYVTRRCNDDATVIDDSRKHDKPMELIMGKKFKFEVWEQCLKTMKVGESASFKIDKSLTGTYPLVSKSLRDIFSGKAPTSTHCCGMSMKDQGLGYPDLDELMKEPEPLECILDVISIKDPGQYEQESWSMDVEQKVKAIPRLKEEGNALYKAGDHKTAGDKYAQALSMLEQLLLREKPGDEDWTALDNQKIPFLLNFAQCKLLQNDFYPVIEHTTEVLKRDPDNVKALYRRAKAHVGAWNPKEARSDYQRVVSLDQTLTKSVQKELLHLDELEAKKLKEDKERYQGKMFG